MRESLNFKLFGKYIVNTLMLITLYILCSLAIRLTLVSNKCNLDDKKRRLWYKTIKTLHLLQILPCYSLSIREVMYIRPEFFGDLYELFPSIPILSDPGERIIEDSIRNLPKGSVVIDIGAHIGKYTLLASQKSSLVIALEPDPSNFNMLKRNCELNKRNNVKIFNAAVSHIDGTVHLFLGKDSALHTIVSRGSSSLSIPVNTLTLDSLVEMNKLKRIDLMKIDIEGAELLVLKRGKSKRALRLTNLFVVEVHKEQYFSQLKKLFSEYGFYCYRVGRFMTASRIKRR